VRSSKACSSSLQQQMRQQQHMQPSLLRHMKQPPLDRHLLQRLQRPLVVPQVVR
jgi:hypothetical protein